MDFQLGSHFLNDTENQLSKQVQKWNTLFKLKHNKKLSTLRLNKTTKNSTQQDQGRVKAAKDYCRRQIIFDLSATPIPEKHTKVLNELGLNFQIAPKVFPVVETISATEVCCQEIEKGEGDPIFLKEKQQEYDKLFSLTSRNTMINQSKAIS